MACCKAGTGLYSINWCTDESTVKAADGKEYCVFHAPVGQKGISGEEFEKKVFERIDKCIQQDDECDFSESIFEWNINFQQYEEKNSLPAIKFAKAKFNGKVWFWRSVFSGEADFSDVIFSGDAVFLGARFKEEANFIDAVFNNRAIFSSDRPLSTGHINGRLVTKNYIRAIFEKGAVFIGTKFNSEADFSGALFNGKANFVIAVFGKQSIFVGARFSGETDFNRSIFKGETYFTRAMFSGETDFSQSLFKGETDFRNVFFRNKARFDFAAFEKHVSFLTRSESDDEIKVTSVFGADVSMRGVRISEHMRMEEVNLSKVTFLDVDPKKLDFVTCKWPKRKGIFARGMKMLYDETQLDAYRGYDDYKHRIEKVEALYRQLKKKAKDDHNEAEASEWHYGEKEMRRKRLGWEDPMLSLYFITSGYAEGPLKAGLVLFILIVLFAFMPSGSCGESDKNMLTCLAENIRIIGSSVKPFHGSSLWGGLFNLFKTLFPLLIYIQTAILALAIRNRYRR